MFLGWVKPISVEYKLSLVSNKKVQSLKVESFIKWLDGVRWGMPASEREGRTINEAQIKKSKEAALDPQNINQRKRARYHRHEH